MQINEIENLTHQYNKSADHVKWIIDTQNVLSEIFGKESKFYEFFISIDWAPSGRAIMVTRLDYEEKLAQIKQEAYLSGLEKAKGILESAINQINRKGLQKTETPKFGNIKSRKVFVVHGRDLKIRDELVLLLKNEFNLDPIILMDKPNQSRTVIEKFEKSSLDVRYAFVILTPDDMGNLDKISAKPKPRARENVILELGYFIGKLGRNNVCCIRKGKPLLPSDLHGLVDIPFKNSVKEIFLDIKNELLESKIISK
ncbi:MAG: nucleotide-binding protein [Nitrosopumilus sp.]|nr:nucleotide-binding protein [Nitrosopumilus sp.]